MGCRCCWRGVRCRAGRAAVKKSCAAACRKYVPPGVWREGRELPCPFARQGVLSAVCATPFSAARVFCCRQRFPCLRESGLRAFPGLRSLLDGQGRSVYVLPTICNCAGKLPSLLCAERGKHHKGGSIGCKNSLFSVVRIH